jgi:hypothetical protein
MVERGLRGVERSTANAHSLRREKPMIYLSKDESSRASTGVATSSNL